MQRPEDTGHSTTTGAGVGGTKAVWSTGHQCESCANGHAHTAEPGVLPHRSLSEVASVSFLGPPEVVTWEETPTHLISPLESWLISTKSYRGKSRSLARRKGHSSSYPLYHGSLGKTTKMTDELQPYLGYCVSSSQNACELTTIMIPLEGEETEVGRCPHNVFFYTENKWKIWVRTWARGTRS